MASSANFTKRRLAFIFGTSCMTKRNIHLFFFRPFRFEKLHFGFSMRLGYTWRSCTVVCSTNFTKKRRSFMFGTSYFTKRNVYLLFFRTSSCEKWHRLKHEAKLRTSPVLGEVVAQFSTNFRRRTWSFHIPSENNIHYLFFRRSSLRSCTLVLA